MSHDILQSLISEIETKIDSTDLNPQVENVGEVFYLGDGVAKVSGLRSACYNEVLEFESGATGVALNLEDHYVGVVVLSGFSKVKEGETLLLLEAMKMQNQVRMPFDGEIVKIYVQKDEVIPNRHLMVEIKPKK